MRRLWPLALLLASCSGVTELSGSGGAGAGAPAKSLPGDEAAALRKKADEAFAKKAWADAWNLEAEAGTDRARLERIAVAALEADSGPYEKMFAQLRSKFGGITPEARARATAIVVKDEGEHRWKDAAKVEIDTAEDPPAYTRAFAVYDRTPPGDALGVLALLQSARADDAEAKAKASAAAAATPAPKAGR